MVVLIEGAVEGDAVGLEEQVLQRVHSLQTEALLDPVRQVGVVEDHIEPKGLRPQSHCWPDSSWTKCWWKTSNGRDSQVRSADKYFNKFDVTIMWVGQIDGSRLCWPRHFNLSSIFSTSYTYVTLHLTFWSETSENNLDCSTFVFHIPLEIWRIKLIKYYPWKWGGEVANCCFLLHNSDRLFLLDQLERSWNPKRRHTGLARRGGNPEAKSLALGPGVQVQKGDILGGHNLGPRIVPLEKLVQIEVGLETDAKVVNWAPAKQVRD